MRDLRASAKQLIIVVTIETRREQRAFLNLREKRDNEASGSPRFRASLSRAKITPGETEPREDGLPLFRTRPRINSAPEFHFPRGIETDGERLFRAGLSYARAAAGRKVRDTFWSTWDRGA